MLSEMLGNQYFLARNYKNAALNLQHVLNEDPTNKNARKKIIICYSQTGEVEKAFENFYRLVKEDINFILNTDPVADDCPCPELVDKFGTILPYEENSKNLKLMLGMLWLYCSANKSLKFFKSLLNEYPENQKISDIILILENIINSTSTNKNQLN